MAKHPQEYPIAATVNVNLSEADIQRTAENGVAKADDRLS
jgi:hypothetical protein